MVTSVPRAARKLCAQQREHRARALGGVAVSFEFFLGAHRPNWLESSPVPLFVSHVTLAKRTRLPRALSRWALDSGGFTELSKHGCWTVSAVDYVASVRRYHREIGSLAFASIQDWMCEPSMLAKTGLTVEEHQRRTVASYLELAALAPELPWLPVLQGWCHGEHNDHLEMYAKAGVDLTRFERVGVGSVCRRQQTIRASLILSDLHGCGLKLHGFGFKLTGLRMSADDLASADSMAWSTHERREKTGRQNCLDAALEWHDEKIGPIMRSRRFPPIALAA